MDNGSDKENMPLYALWLAIIALYWRTCTAYRLIDDYTPRHQYPEPEKEAKDPKFYMTKPKWWVHPFMIAMHCVNTSIIYMLWGWAPATLFAVHPMGMWGTAWITGNYYATTLYFLLIAQFAINTFPGWGMIPAAGLYWVAMMSTFDAIPYPFILMLAGNTYSLGLFPLTALFLNSSKFRNGLLSRLNINKGKVIDRTDYPLNRIAFMVKVVARYTYQTIVPMKISLFEKWAESIRDFKHVYDDMHSFNREFWSSLALLVTVFGVGLLISPFGTLWFFILIALHSQFNIVGQTYAQRYIYIALPGLCIVFGHMLPAWAIYAVAGWFACRTHMGMKKWMNQEVFLQEEIDANPERGESYGVLGQFYMTVLPLEGYQPFMINMIAYLIRRSCILAPESWQQRINLAAYLCKTGYVDEGLVETRKAIDLLKKYSCDREKHLIADMEEQYARWTKIGADLKLRRELYARTGRNMPNSVGHKPKSNIILP